MPKISTTPPGLKPFLFHGLDLEEKSSGQGVGECPFCGKAGKFHANSESGQWDCKSCMKKGNHTSFIQELWKQSDEATIDYGPLKSSRGVLNDDTLMRWGVVRSIVDNTWCVAGYTAAQKLVNLYRYEKLAGKTKSQLLCTNGLNHALHVPTGELKGDWVYVCEGPWDGMALWEVLRAAKPDGSGYTITGSESMSALNKVSVIAVPGAGTWKDEWTPLLKGKSVAILFDSDHPKTLPDGKTQLGSGYEGAKRLSQILARSEDAPNELYWLEWGPEGYDPSKPSGFDVRDFFLPGKTLGERVKLLPQLEANLKPIPENWIAGRSKLAAKTGKVEIEPLECKSYKTLATSWRKAMRWSDGLDRALVTMLCSICSTELPGDQLWVKIVGPPSCGKSTLCEAICVAKKYVVGKSTIRGFHSGYKESNDDAEDNSLIHACRNKTLVTKDGDTLLQAPNVSQILSEARDVYDRVSRTHYRNKASKVYEDLNLTWILCGTASLRSLDSSELGERFLDCVIMDKVDEETEEAICLKQVNKVIAAMAAFNGVAEHVKDSVDAEATAKRLTGGYVNYLRQNIYDLVGHVKVSEAAAQAIISYATFVAFTRSRPSKTQEEEVQREMAARLVGQLTRLAVCTAVVMNLTEVNAEILRRVRRTALDTARGMTFDMMKVMYDKRAEGGAPAFYVCSKIDADPDSVKWKNNLRHLLKIEAIRKIKQPNGKADTLMLTPRLQRLYQAVTAE